MFAETVLIGGSTHACAGTPCTCQEPPSSAFFMHRGGRSLRGRREGKGPQGELLGASPSAVCLGQTPTLCKRSSEDTFEGWWVWAPGDPAGSSPWGPPTPREETWKIWSSSFLKYSNDLQGGPALFFFR